MIAPVASKIQLPEDRWHSGKMKRTQTRVIGANTVHEDMVVVVDKRDIVGVFKAQSPVAIVPIAAQDGITTGFLWLYNPVASTIKMQISNIKIRSQFAATAIDQAVGELRLSRFTFTGINSSALITPASIDSTFNTNQGEVADAWATAVASLGATIDANFYQTMDSAVGAGGSRNPLVDTFNVTSEHEEIILRPGEGVVIWHAASVTTNNRRLMISVAWVEFN